MGGIGEAFLTTHWSMHGEDADPIDQDKNRALFLSIHCRQKCTAPAEKCLQFITEVGMMVMSYPVSSNSESIFCQNYGPLQTILHIAQENAVKLTTITVCVDYSDIFKFALAHNHQILKDYHVVTTPQDKDTHTLCQQYKLHVIATNSFYDDRALFNRGKAINDGLEQSRISGWVLLLDADIFLPPQFLDILSTKQLDHQYLYSANRRLPQSMLRVGVKLQRLFSVVSYQQILLEQIDESIS